MSSLLRQLKFRPQEAKAIDALAIELREDLVSSGLRFPPRAPSGDGVSEFPIAYRHESLLGRLEFADLACSVLCFGSGSRLDEVVCAFPGRHSVRWLGAEECQRIRRLTARALESESWNLLLCPQDLHTCIAEWLAVATRRVSAPLSQWLSGKARDLVGWNWVWFELPLDYSLDYVDFQVPAHLTRRLSLRKLTGRDACALLMRAVSRWRGSEPPWRQWAGALDLPRVLRESHVELPALLELHGAAPSPLLRGPETTEEELLVALDVHSRAYASYLEFGSTTRCLERAAAAHSKLLPFLALGESSADSLEPSEDEASSSSPRRGGFVLAGRTRIPSGIEGGADSVGSSRTRPWPGWEDGESLDLEDLPWKAILGVLQNPERHLDRTLYVAAAVAYRALRSGDLGARLVLLTTAAEVLFEGGLSRETSRDQITRRMAELSYLTTAEKRAEARRLVRAAIDLRNEVVHEGQNVSREHWTTILGFQRAVVQAIFAILNSREKYSAKETYLRVLDERSTKR